MAIKEAEQSIKHLENVFDAGSVETLPELESWSQRRRPVCEVSEKLREKSVGYLIGHNLGLSGTEESNH